MTPTRPNATAWHACCARARPAGRQRWLAGVSCMALAGLLWLLALPGWAHAGALPGELPADLRAEPPAIVGRLSTVQGEVRWYDRDNAAWLGSAQQPLRNWPLAAGDRLRTGPDARAELRVGGATVRLGADVDLTLQQLNHRQLALRLQAGTLALRLSAAEAGDLALVSVITPEGRWLPLRPGHYRLERQDQARTPATQATVWRGELRFEAADSALVIPAGRRADLWQDPGRGATRYAWATVERDAFADWVARDELGDDAPVSARHVPPGMTGWQDLDRHGDWLDNPEYGSVWQPRVVAPGWAPFHDGRWAWVSPWGWTWIDAAPWGFAPFHYGSWVMLGGRWCWSPGPRQIRPRFAPVHPGWVSGPQLGIGIQIGGGHRPPPPRVVIPVAPPPPIVVVLPPPHRDARPDGRRRDDRDERRPWRGAAGDRGDRGDRGPGPDRPDRHHWAERVDRSPVLPAVPLAHVAPAAPAAPAAPVAPVAPAPTPVLPVKPPPAPGPKLDAPHAALPQPGPPLRPDAGARPDRPQRPITIDGPDRPERSDRNDNAGRGRRPDAQAWR